MGDNDTQIKQERPVAQETIVEKQQPLYVTEQGATIDLLQINLNGPGKLEWRIITTQGMSAGCKAISEHGRVVVAINTPQSMSTMPMEISQSNNGEGIRIGADGRNSGIKKEYK